MGIAFVMTAVPAAAKYLSTGYDLYNIPYDYSGSSANYLSNTSADHWNQKIGVTVNHVDNAENWFFHYDYNDGWLGLYQPDIVGGNVDSFNISINRTELEVLNNSSKYDDEATYWQLAINTSVHEFGHALFLGDYESKEGVGDNSIMSYSRDRTNSVPRTRDVNEIKDLRN